MLIQKEMNQFFLCEIKCKKMIDRSVISEVARKIDVISLPRRSSIRPVLIYEG